MDLEDYFNEIYQILDGLVDYICTSPIIYQFGSIYKYELYEFLTLEELKTFLLEHERTHYISICYFDCIKYNNLDYKNYRIRANLYETKQKLRGINLNELLSM